MPKTKIDKGRALSIMGFGSSRPLDACLGNFQKAREILDEALFKKTQEILHGPASQGRDRTGIPKKPAKGPKGQKPKGKRGSVKDKAKNKKKATAKEGSVGEEEDGEEDDDLDLYSYKWENLTRAEQNQCLHESYQFLVKKYIPKDQRKKSSEKSSSKEQKPVKETASKAEEPLPPEPEESWTGEPVPETIDSALDFKANDRDEGNPSKRRRPILKRTSSRNTNTNTIRNPPSTQDPRKRALQNRAKKERNELMKCTQNGTHSCQLSTLKKYDVNRDGRIDAKEMNEGSRKIATQYRQNVNFLKSQDPRKQNLQKSAKKERTDLVKCFQNPSTGCKRSVLRRYDSDGDGKINDKEEKVGSRRIAIEYKRKFKALRPPPGDMKARSRSTRRGTNVRKVDIMNRMKTLKKFKKSLTACSDNPKRKGCARTLSQADRNRDGSLSSEEQKKAEQRIDRAYDRLKNARKFSQRSK